MKVVLYFICIFLFLNMVSASIQTTLSTEIDAKTSPYLTADFNSEYGTIKLSSTIFWIDTDKIAEYSLIENTEYCYSNCYARGKVVLYKDGQIFEDLYLIDKNKMTEYTKSSVKLFYTPEGEKEQEYSGDVLKAGNYEWRIEGTKGDYDNVDWVIKSFGSYLTEWADWDTYTWEKNLTINQTLPDIGTRSSPTIFQKDGEWFMLAGEYNTNKYYGYKYNGTTWITNLTINTTYFPFTSIRYSPNVFNISNDYYMLVGEENGTFYGYSWNGTGWITNITINNSLIDIGSRSNPFVYNIGNNLFMIAGNDVGTLIGFSWNGTDWLSNFSVNKSLVDIGQGSNPCVFYKGNSLFMIAGENTGVFYGFLWNGTDWLSNSTINSSLPDIGTMARPSVYIYNTYLHMLAGENAGRFFGYRFNESITTGGGDTTPPTWITIPNNQTIYENNLWDGVFFNATDDTAISLYTTNDTNFIFNSSQFLINNTALSLGVYTILIQVNDSSNNKNYSTFKLSVIEQPTPPTPSATTSTNKFAYNYLTKTATTSSSSIIENDCGSDIAFGIFTNSTLKCKSIASGSEIDPYWTANYSTFLTHINWTTAMNGTLAKSSELNNGSYLNLDWLLKSQWNSTNTSYMLISNWNATNTSYMTLDNATIQNQSLVNYIGIVNTSMNNSVKNLLNILNNGSYLNSAWNSTNTTYITWAEAMNGTLFKTSQWNATNTSYYLTSNPSNFFNNISNFTSLRTDGKVCKYISATDKIECNSDGLEWASIINGTIWSWSMNGTLALNSNLSSYRLNNNNTFYGNISIGTTSLNYPLSIYSNYNGSMIELRTIVGLATDSASIRFGAGRTSMGYDGSVQGASIRVSDSSKPIIFANSLTEGTGEIMRIKGDGSVGIGTTTPQNALNVLGDGNFTGAVYAYGINLSYNNVSMKNYIDNTFNSTRNNYIVVVNTSMKNYVGTILNAPTSNLTIGSTTSNMVTITNILQITSYGAGALPTNGTAGFCGSTYAGSMMRNTTGVWGCVTTGATSRWKLIY